MDKIILEAVRLGLWRQFDIQFARMLIQSHQYDLMLVIVTLCFYVNRGHVCLPLSMLIPDRLFCGVHIVLATKICKKVGDLSIEDWKKLLIFSTIVGDGSYPTPLVLDKERLYLYRMWKNEVLVAQFFYFTSQKFTHLSECEIDQIVKLLNQFFPIVNRITNHDDSEYNLKDNHKNFDWQKIGISIILMRQLTIISGGPGTGKTSIIVKLLVIISLLYSQIFLNVRIVAPTGKSVSRLNECINSMDKILSSIKNNNNRKKYFSVYIETVHRLLGIYSYKQNIKRAHHNFSCLDYLILDECSMLDLSMIAKIITMISAETKIIFLGDYKQLPSIGAGSVFSDICHFFNKGYTSMFCKQLKKITNYDLSCYVNERYDSLNNFCLLNKNYRFSNNSGIGKLVQAVNSGNKYNVLSLLISNASPDLRYTVLNNNEIYLKMLTDIALGYSKYFEKIKNCNYKNLEFILSVFNEYRILCVLREGPFGVSQLNFLIEKILNRYGLIHQVNNNQNYIGRPIIITSNDPDISLFNGEIGIILPDNNTESTIKLSAYFLSLNNNVKKVLLHQLPKYETAFVITIHKSQGSEFKHVALIFPNKVFPILTRELFYTGITRASKYLSVYATNKIINYSISNLSIRYTGLIDKLKNLIKN